MVRFLLDRSDRIEANIVVYLMYVCILDTVALLMLC